MPVVPKRFHFDLLHLGDTPPDLVFHVGLHQYPVERHTTETRAAAVKDNQALALIPPTHHHRITHFADISHEHLPTDRICRLKVTYDHGDQKLNLPALVHASFHIPEKYRTAHRQRKFAQPGTPQIPRQLLKYGVDPDALVRLQTAARTADKKAPRILKAGPSMKAAPPVDQTDDSSGDDIRAQTPVIYNDLDNFQRPIDAAAFILFHHPGLGSSDPHTAARIMDDHINSPENEQALTNLAVAIESKGQGAEGWVTLEQVMTPDGVGMTYEYQFGGNGPGDAVMHYVLAQEVLDAMPAALKQPLKSAANDPALQNKKWSVTQGQTAVHQTNAAEPQPGGARLLKAARAAPTFKWTIAAQSASHGLLVDNNWFDANSQNDGSGTFHVDARNSFLRTLAAYIEFCDETGNVIRDPEAWDSKLPPGLRRLETSSKKYIGTIPPVNNIMGIPCPTDATGLSFFWPSKATSARLLFGGLGNGEDWDGDVCAAGVILTGIFQYGIPVMFLAASTGIKNTKWYKDFVANPSNVELVLGVAIPVVGTSVGAGAVFGNTKRVLFSFADVVGGILVKTGLEALLAQVTEEMAENEAAEAVPFAGWVLLGLLVGAELAQIAETTGEVLSSPSTLRYDIARAFDLKVTISPDPKHGMPDKPETAVWPAVSDNYEVIVQYQGGTNFIQHGDMPKTTSNKPVSLTFSELPAGGKIQIIAAIYSQSGWLCGKWTSGWLDAVPNADSTLTVPPGTIAEQLVPLTADSQYAHKEKIVYQADQSKHIWKAGSPSTATFLDLSSKNTGPALSKLVNLTIFERTFEIGYSWQAASQGLPMTGETATNSGQAYAFRNLSVLADPESQLKFPNRSFAAQPYIVYDQFGQPTDISSGSKPHQFFLDPRNAKYHLRQLKLDDGKSSIDLTTPLQSWGQFPLPHIDAIVINSGKIIAASWHENKLAILNIPDTPSADGDAQTATLVSGEGDRQGLLRGPIAMAVTPDGRVLVLETENRRIQAFDLSGNPVPSFDGEMLFSVRASDFATQLDQKTFSEGLKSAFQQSKGNHLFDLDAEFLSDLNLSNLSDDLVDAFSLNGIFLSVDNRDATANSTITVVTASRQWQIECQGTKRVYIINAAPQATSLSVDSVLTNVTVTVRKAGQQWIINDKNGCLSYDIQASRDRAGMLDVYPYLSFMPLQNATPEEAAVYLDLASEARGYVYVLYFTGDGSNTTDYFLDIYEPNGAFLCRTPDSRFTSSPQNVVAARLVVDTWRNAFTLNYEAMAGPNGSTEPSIGHWMPMPPLFSLELPNQPAFDNADKSSVSTVFSTQHKPITLTPSFTITTISTAGHWKVIDGGVVYDVIRSGDKLDVYKLAAGATI